MTHSTRIAAVALLAALVAGAASPAESRAPGARSRTASATRGGFLALQLPFGFFRVFHPAPAATPLEARIERRAGWTPVRFAVGEDVNAVYLEISGTARLGRADLRFADGGTVSRDLSRDATYRSGVYALADLDGTRALRDVTLEASADSRRARVRLLLGRTAQ